MNLHVRQQGKKYAFRLRLSRGYVDSHETYDTEEEAAFAADLAKFYLRTFYHVLKNTDPTLDGDVFSTLAYRLNVELTNQCAVLALLAPGVKEYLSNHQTDLELHAETNRPERKAWEALRESSLFNSSFAVQSWVLACEAAEKDAADFAEIDARSFATRLEVARGAMETALKSLRVASRMHDNVGNARLVERSRIIAELITHIAATEAHVRFVAGQFKDEEARVAGAIALLESNRPALY